MVGAGHRARARRPGPAVRHLYPQAARRAPHRGAARCRGRAVGHCRRAVGRRRRALHGGPLRRRSGNTDTAPEAGHGAAGTVVTRGRRRNAGRRHLRARRLAIATERPVAPQGPTRHWRPGNRRARPALMPRPGHPGKDRTIPAASTRNPSTSNPARGRPSPSHRAGRRKITVTIAADCRRNSPWTVPAPRRS